MIKFKGELWVTCIAVLTAATGTTLAQSSNDPYADPQQDPAQQAAPQPAPAPPPMAEPEPYEDYGESEPGSMASMKRIGFSLSLGGGVVDFTDSDMRDTTGVGGSWAVRAAFGTKTPIGFEASYIGSAQSIDALGLDNDAVLVSNGLQGALRINALMDSAVTPFIFGGIGWVRYDLTNVNRNTSAISGKDDVLEFPVGVGIGGSYRGFGYDLRGELRFATKEDMVPELSAGRVTDNFADMHRWGVNATLGYGF